MAPYCVTLGVFCFTAVAFTGRCRQTWSLTFTCGGWEPQTSSMSASSGRIMSGSAAGQPRQRSWQVSISYRPLAASVGGGPKTLTLCNGKWQRGWGRRAKLFQPLVALRIVLPDNNIAVTVSHSLFGVVVSRWRIDQTFWWFLWVEAEERYARSLFDLE